MPFPALPGPLDRALTEKGYAEPTPVQAAVLQTRPRAAICWCPRRPAPARPSPSASPWPRPSSAQGRVRRAGATARARGRAHPRTGPAGAAGAELALRARPARASSSCVGGMDMRARAARPGAGAHIVVGTPGRLRDHLERGNLDISELRGRGARRGRRDAGPRLPRRPGVHPGSHAARAPHPAVLGDARQGDRRRWPGATSGMRCASTRPASDEPHADIEYRAVRIAPNEREHAIVNVLRFFEARGAMVFCHTREAVRKLHAQPSGARLLRRGALRRAETERAQPGAPGPARRPCPCLRRHGRRGARDRPAGPRPRDPCRSAERERRPPASQRPHRPSGAEGHLRAPRALPAAA